MCAENDTFPLFYLYFTYRKFVRLTSLERNKESIITELNHGCNGLNKLDYLQPNVEHGRVLGQHELAQDPCFLT